jgi:hypothetical protein
MDDDAVQWMVERLEEHLANLELNNNVAYNEQIEGLAVSLRIIQKVLPDETLDIDPFRDDAWRWQAQTLIAKALGVLRHRAEILAYLDPVGPAMPADGLHPIVWSSASKLWEDGHYGLAVQRAATFLNAHVQDKTGRRDLSDSGLMGQAFSLSAPEVGKPRLRWPGNDTDQTVKSMRGGILSFAQGVYMAIRNPTTHGTDDLPRQVALEQLATLSTLARWIDGCEVVVVDGVAI